MKLKKRQQSANAKLIKGHLAPDSIPAEKKKPLFSFQYLDPEYCISRCEKKDKAALADQLRILGSKTWTELHQASRHGIGYEKIGKNSIKTGLPEHLKNDDITFFAFRFSGKKPMVGYRYQEIFYIIWLDRDYSLYEHC